MPPFLVPIFVRCHFFLYWSDCFHHILHIACQWLVSINFHKYILRFWSNHAETDNRSGPWSWDILSSHRFCRSRQQNDEIYTYLIPHCNNFSHHMLKIVNHSPSISALMIPKPFLRTDNVILIHAVSEWSLIRVQKDPFFGDCCFKILKYIQESY